MAEFTDEMHYNEQIVYGKLCYQEHPGGAWIPICNEILSARVISLMETLNEIKTELEQEKKQHEIDNKGPEWTKEAGLKYMYNLANAHLMRGQEKELMEIMTSNYHINETVAQNYIDDIKKEISERYK